MNPYRTIPSGAAQSELSVTCAKPLILRGRPIIHGTSNSFDPSAVIFFRLAPIFCPEKGFVWKRLKRLHREVSDGIDTYNDVAIYTVKSKNKLNKNIIHILDHSSPTYGQSCDGDGMHFRNNHRVRRELLYRTCKALCGNACEKRYLSKLEGSSHDVIE